MADITKCNNVECPLRLKCYRFTSTSSYHQSWFNFTYDKGCKSFWKNEHKPNKQIL